MARDAGRVSFKGPWRGVNERIAAEVMPYEFLASSSNAEIYGGQIRARRGRSRIITGPTVGSTQDPTISMVAIPDAEGDDPSLVLAQVYDQNGGGTDQSHFYICDLAAASATAVSKTGAGNTAALNFNNTGGTIPQYRATYFNDDMWTIMSVGSGAAPYAYKRSGSTNYFRKAGLEVPIHNTSAADHFDVATSLVAGGSQTAGTYKYQFTFYSSISGLESNVSASTVITSTPAAGNLTTRLTFTNFLAVYDAATNITGVFADKIRVYRTQVDGTTFTLLTELSWGNQTYDDTASDASIINAVGYPTTHGVPPVGTQHVCFHRGRAFYNPGFTPTIYYSEAFDQTPAVHGSEYVQSTSFFGLSTGGLITGMWSFGEQLIVFQRDAVWSIDTSTLPGLPIITRLRGGQGCAAYWTIAEGRPRTLGGQARLYYANELGAYEFDGSGSRCLTTDFQTTWSGLKGGYDNNSTTVSGSSGYPKSFYHASAIYDPNYDQYLLACQYTSDTLCKRVLCYSVESDGWMPWTLTQVDFVGSAAEREIRCFCSGVFSPSGYTALKPYVVFGGNGGVGIGILSRFDEISLDHDVAVAWTFTTGKVDFGDPFSIKHLQDIGLVFKNASGGNSTVAVTLNYESSTKSMGSLSLIAATTLDFLLSAKIDTRRVSLTFTGTTGLWRPGLAGWMFNFEPRRMHG